MPTLYEIFSKVTVDHALEDGLGDEERRDRAAVRDVIAAVGPGIERNEFGGMVMGSVLLASMMVMMSTKDLDEALSDLADDIRAQVAAVRDELGPPSFVGIPHKIRAQPKEN